MAVCGHYTRPEAEQVLLHLMRPNQAEQSCCTIISRGQVYMCDFSELSSVKCLVGVAYLPVSALWKEISTIPTDKKLNQLKYSDNYGAETFVKFCSQKVLISRLL